MATSLMTKFLMDIGYAKDLIGYTNKLFGLVATIVGTLAGGSLMGSFGLKRSLWIFGIFQSFVGLSFVLLPRLVLLEPEWKEMWLILMVVVDNFMMGLGTAALTGFMMSFVNRQFTGTQYALLTSVMAVARVILIGPSGVIVEKIGWDMFYILTVPLALPGLLLLYQFDHWQTEAAKVSQRLSWASLLNIAVFMASLLLLVTPPVWRYFGWSQPAHWAEQGGAFGILLVVLLGVVKPYLVVSHRSRAGGSA